MPDPHSHWPEATPDPSAPAYPGEAPPPYPGEEAPPYPGDGPPPCPDMSAPVYPGGEAPAYPGEEAPPYPGAAPPPYPDVPAPAYPGEEAPAYPEISAPAYPGEKAPPYPGEEEEAPPRPDGLAPSYPDDPAPAYPGEEAPPYPGEEAPSYPGDPAPGLSYEAPPVYPGDGGPVRQELGGGAGEPESSDEWIDGPGGGTQLPDAAPAAEVSNGPDSGPEQGQGHDGLDGVESQDDLALLTGRRHLKSQQRGMDRAALWQMVAAFPTALVSLCVVFIVFSLFNPLAGPVAAVLWVLSGPLVFQRKVEAVIARRMLGMREPTPAEAQRLDAVWSEVTRRAGVTPGTYQLWVQERAELNATAAAGHIVGVTRHAMERLPNSRLAAVLAHELGHHVGGHTWAGMLADWYALPARTAWRLTLLGLLRLLRSDRPGVMACGGCLTLVLGYMVFALTFMESMWWLTVPLAVGPLLVAWLQRQAEFRADAYAAGLGFGPELEAVLEAEHQSLPTPEPAPDQNPTPAPYVNPYATPTPNPYATPTPNPYTTPNPHANPRPPQAPPPSGVYGTYVPPVPPGPPVPPVVPVLEAASRMPVRTAHTDFAGRLQRLRRAPLPAPR
ncbi:M48 family metalloprotease [Streptomyces sp. NPDC002073]